MNFVPKINSNLFTVKLSGPAPAACALAPVSWRVNGNTCNATATTSASGGNSSFKDIVGLTTGSASLGDHHAR